MSDERFELAYEQGNWWAVRDGDITLWKEEVVDKLNEQQAIINKLKEENDGIKTKGLDVLAFYENKLKNVVGTEDFQSVRDEIWIVRQVLYEMGVINDE